MVEKQRTRRFPSAGEDVKAAEAARDNVQSRSPSYRLAFADEDFLVSDEVRPIRLQLEYMKPELLLQEQGIETTIVVLGSARIPAREQAEQLLAQAET